MVSLKLQKRLAAAVLKCGKRKVWMDPSEVSNIAVANSRQSVRSMIKNGMIVKKHNLMHSRARVNIRHEAKARGNHTGYGKRHGTMNARIPEKLLWMRRIRVLRRLLRKYRDAGKIDKHMYAHFYALAKGNRYKTKRVLIEQIHRKKGEDKKEKQLAEQATALLNQKRAAMEASA
ncbi:Ribosomal protein L19 [Blastocystis hominis]|nr:Ribosomal protein L19 [Blastocystis hominis]XP_012896209.1 Ribosomal protein L19 [Blastocystis hominis]CBK21015.2 Ribosomal protein L19 [Blastocystis hominis]CBK22161.2 Ribosomal protein L19 [Blastocystis hominis]|eukprot:XP_012895063.1 Ribosomal protein L19 [Blastocystis hominis]